jgi:hypothetical protein
MLLRFVSPAVRAGGQFAMANRGKTSSRSFFLQGDWLSAFCRRSSSQGVLSIAGPPRVARERLPPTQIGIFFGRGV